MKKTKLPTQCYMARETGCEHRASYYSAMHYLSNHLNSQDMRAEFFYTTDNDNEALPILEV